MAFCISDGVSQSLSLGIWIPDTVIRMADFVVRFSGQPCRGCSIVTIPSCFGEACTLGFFIVEAM